MRRPAKGCRGRWRCDEGSDAIGDVQVLPAGARPVSPVPDRSMPPLDQVIFAELYAGVLAPEPNDLVAIPGAQDKVSGRMISLPLSLQGAAFILKLDPPEFPHLVANEAYFAAAARASGLEVADTRIVHDRIGRPGLLVSRFDRRLEQGHLRSLAQEDACQVLDHYPADKYRLTAEQVVAGLAQRTGAPIVAARVLLQQLAFAYLSGNGDAHAKNFSILQRGGEWRIAPAYDLPSSLPYGDTTTALSIGGKDREDIGRADFLALGQRCRVPAKATARVLDELLAAMPSWLDRLGELPFDVRTVHELGRACAYRAARLRG